MSMIKRTVFQYQIGAKGSSITKPIINQADVLTNIIDLVVKDNGQPFDLEALGLTVDFHFLNSVGEYLTVPANEIVSDTASVIIPQSIIEYGGTIEFEIEIHDAEKSLNATGFSFTVEKTKRKSSGAFPTNPIGITQVSWADILEKPDYYTPTVHNHLISELTDFPSQSLNSGKVLSTDGSVLYWSDVTANTINWIDIVDKPSSFVPTEHTHAMSEINNLETSLDLKADLAHTHLIEEINNLQAILDSKSDVTHTHTASELGISSGVINVMDYGAVGDGVTDDSEAFMLALADVPLKGGHLYFPPAVYMHGDGIADPINGTGNSYPNDPDDTSEVPRPLMSSDSNLGRNICMKFDGYEDLTISGYGATIKSHPNNGEVKNNAMFEINNCTNVLIEGLTLDGNSHNRQPSLSDYDNGQGWNNRSNLSIGGGNNIRIIEVVSNYSMMDGFAIGGNEGVPIRNLYIEKCSSDYAYRNGLTLSTCVDVEVSKSSFTNTGVTYGTFPKIGIDIEADWGGTMNENIVIEDTYFNGNVVAGIAFAVGARNCHLNRCIFDGANQSPAFSFDSERWGYNYIKNCRFVNTGLPTNTNAVYVENNTFELFPVANEGESISMSFFHLQGSDQDGSAYTYIRDNTFKVDLSNVSELATSVDVGRMWFGSRKNVVFSGNTVINLYSAGSAGFYIINWSDWVTQPDYQLKDNTFVFSETRLLGTMNDSLIASDYGATKTSNFSNGNRAVGYPVSVKALIEMNETVSFVSGQNFVKSQVLSNGSVYKIDPIKLASDNPNLMTNTKIEIYLLDGKTVLDFIGGWSNTPRLVHYVENKPSEEIPTGFNFYYLNGSIYIDVNAYYASLKVEINFAGGNGYVYMSSFENAIEELETVGTILDTANPISYSFIGKSISDVSILSNHVIDVGHSIFYPTLNKPIWWTGSQWVDSSGTVIN